MLTLLCLLLLLSMGSGAAQPAAPLVPVPDPLAGGARVTLTWEPGANTVAAALSGYRVYQSTQSGAYGAPRQQVPPTVTTATVEGLTPGATYFFVVTAVNTRGEESANSNEATITLPEPPVVPPVEPPVEPRPGLRVNILDYGATPDDDTDDAPAIRRAISEVLAAGGGQVNIPPGSFHIPGVLPAQSLPVASVTARSAQADYPPTFTRDENLGTRWSAEGPGQWIQYDFGTVETLTMVDIAWYQGQKRKARFQLRISQDGTTWQIYTGESSGTSTGFERVFTGPAPARYLQIVCNGNSLNQWNSITEVRLSGVRP